MINLLKKLQKDFICLCKRITKVENEMVTLPITMADVTGLPELAIDVETNTTDIDTLEADVIAIELAINTLQNDMTAVQADITALKAKDVIIEQDIVTIKNNINTINTTITSINNRIDGIDVEIASLQGNDVALDDKINTLISLITILENRVTVVENDIADISMTITTLDNKVEAHFVDQQAHKPLFDLKEDKSNKGVADGYTPLNENIKVDNVYLDIVDDLTTGGSTNILSAEQGVILDNKINALSGSVGAGDLQVVLGNGHITTKNIEFTSTNNLQKNYVAVNGMRVQNLDPSNNIGIFYTSENIRYIEYISGSPVRNNSINFKRYANGDASWRLGDRNGIFHVAAVEDLSTKADLVNGLVPTSQLPSFVDDVLEFTDFASFPAAGESGKLYLDLSSNDIYRWSGSTYIKMSSANPTIPTIDDVLSAGNTTDKTLNTTGDVYTRHILATGTAVFKGETEVKFLKIERGLRDSYTSYGSVGQVLSADIHNVTGQIAVKWVDQVDLSTVDLQKVLDNTGTNPVVGDIMLKGYFETLTAGIYSLSVQDFFTVKGEFIDSVNSKGNPGQVLTAVTVLGKKKVEWQNLPSYTPPSLQEVLNTGSSATGDIDLIGTIVVTDSITADNIYANNLVQTNDLHLYGGILAGGSGYGSQNDVLISTGSGTQWQDLYSIIPRDLYKSLEFVATGSTILDIGFAQKPRLIFINSVLLVSADWSFSNTRVIFTFAPDAGAIIQII